MHRYRFSIDTCVGVYFASNITGAQSVQIGDYNTQNIINSFEALVKQIEASSASSADKQEAKSRLKAFLSHPLVVSVFGAAVGDVFAAASRRHICG